MKKKIFQIDGLESFIRGFDLANIFNVHYDVANRIGDNYALSYNINSTLIFKDIDKAPATYFDEYSPKESDSWNLISWNQYGTVRLWWLICKVNGIADPTIEPMEFETLRILKKDRVNSILTQMRKP